MNNIVYAGAAEQRSDYHANKCYEILCCNADGEIMTQDGAVGFLRGDALIIPPLLRYLRSGGAADDVSVLLDQALLPVTGLKRIIGKGAEDLFGACRQATDYFNGDFGKKEIVLTALGDLIASFVTAYAGGNGFSPVVEAVIADVEKNLSDATYSLEDFIRTLPLNYDYVRKLFKKETGATPHGYLTDRRMALAKNLILSGIANRYSNYTVSQIAESCGFSEPLYFSRVFKKYFGVAPSEYGKNN